MAVLVWSERDGVLGNAIRTGRRFSLSAEEYRPEAEALDEQLDSLLDMAWHALTVITKHDEGEPRYDTLEQAWVWGRSIQLSSIMRHHAMLGEQRILLWQALAGKAWNSVRSDSERDERWRDLIPRKSRWWLSKPNDINAYRFLEIGYWLRNDSLQQVGEVFFWKFSNAYDLYDRRSLRASELRQAVSHWTRKQGPEVRQFLATPVYKGKRHAFVAKALVGRFPAKGPGSALLPQHYPEDELRAIVCETLDEARDKQFPHLSEQAG